MATNIQVTRDWENDGVLRITGAETLKHYSELKERQHNIPTSDYGIFFAFSTEQFKEGYNNLVKRGLIKDGEKVCGFGAGAYGLKEGMKRWMSEADAIDEQISRECDPFEVYCYEYNNFECCIDYDGDERAVKEVLRLFGLERTREALEGRRMRACSEIDEIHDKV